MSSRCPRWGSTISARVIRSRSLAIFVSRWDWSFFASWYSAFVVLRLGGILWLAARTWQLARSRPPVRDEEGAVVDSPWADEESDDLAGPLRGAPDQLVVRFG